MKLNKNINNIQNQDILQGLSKGEVDKRIKEGNYNKAVDSVSKTTKEIVIDNVFTFFNLLNLILATLIVIVKSYENALFMGIVISNTAIGIIQEVRAKKTIDKLSLVSASKAKVIRGSKEVEVNTEDIVIDDIIKFSSGDEISVDSIVLQGNVEVNESLLTGEVDEILKHKGDTLLSGSFIVSGTCYAKADKVGTNSYTARITKEVKKRKKVNSEIVKSLDKIIKYIAIVIVPIGLILFFKQMYVLNYGFKKSIVSTVAAVIGMIPEGLYLLTSISLAVSVIRLGKRKILVQELHCIETLARVDIICLDKTGTITEGKMNVREVIILDDKYNDENINKIIGAITHTLDDENSTFNSLRRYFKQNPNWEYKNKVPFSSERKWSGVSFKEEGSFVIGAPEFVLNEEYISIKDKVEEYSSKGYRVLLLSKYNKDLTNDKLDKDIEKIALIIIEDKIRDNVEKTFEFFENQGVKIKVISGDNPVTVSKIAKIAGVKNADKYVDASTLNTKDDINIAVDKYTVFGRVKPEQKREIIKSLKGKGHTVAMTGDGVNDVLALKDSDCSIAMASGSDAARRISQLVLTDSNFKSIPSVVNEGRRVINNIGKSASLFLVKTIYSFLLSVLFLIIMKPYPFIPIQLTLISTLTIGIPSFFFALESNNSRIKNGFLRNIIKRAIVGALTIVINTLSILFISNKVKMPYSQISSIIFILTGFTGLVILFKVSRPFNTKRKILFTLMSVLFFLIVLLFGDRLMIYRLSFKNIIILLVFMLITPLIMKVISIIVDKAKILNIEYEN
nr:cation-translocating P-type ATPase [uncultured Romboutsia sp.]